MSKKLLVLVHSPGMVGLIISEYLTRKIEGKIVEQFVPPAKDLVVIEKSIPHTPIRLYDMNNFYMLVFESPMKSENVAEILDKVIEKYSPEEIIFILSSPPKLPPKQEEKREIVELEKDKSTIDFGIVRGFPARIYYYLKQKGLNFKMIIVEALDIIDCIAALEVLRHIKKYGIEVDLSELEKEIPNIEKQKEAREKLLKVLRKKRFALHYM